MEKYSTPQRTETHFTTVHCKNLKSMGFGITKRCSRPLRQLEPVSGISNSSTNWCKKLKHSEQNQARKKNQDSIIMNWVTKAYILRKPGRDQRKTVMGKPKCYCIPYVSMPKGCYGLFEDATPPEPDPQG